MKSTLQKPLLLPLAAVLALLFNSAANGASYPSTITNDHPVAYYRLEELDGLTVSDATTNQFDGNITYVTQQDGITVYPQLGLPGLATNSVLFRKTDSLSGQNGNIDVPVNSTINPTTDGTNGAPFTAEFWVQAATQPSNFEVPLDDSSDFNQPSPWNNSAGWNFYQTVGPNSTWSYSIRPNPGFVGNGPAVVVGQWAHLVLSYNGTNAIFYVNGAAALTNNVPSFLANNGAEDLVFGQGPATGFAPFDGNLDEVAIYSYPLTASQVLTHYQVGTNSIRAVPTAPSFLSQPASISAYAGTPVTFSVTAGGTAPLHYQWLRGISSIPNATNSTYSFIAHYPADDQVAFSVVVTNIVSSSNSAAATLTVLTNLNMVHDPFFITRRVGSYAAFRVVANGALPLTYQWSRSTNAGATFAPIAGATNDTVWVSNVQLSDDQSIYFAHVTGPFGNADSGQAILGVTNRTVAVPITGYAKVVVADKPVAYWRLDEPTNSTTATDAVGSFDGSYLAPAGTLTFGYPTGIPHETNAAIHVTNTAIVTIPYALELSPVTGPWSAEFWIQPTSLDPNNFHTPISSEDNTLLLGTTLFGWNIYQHVAGVWTWNLYSGGGGGSFTSEFTDSPIVPGTWYHMVLTDDLTTLRWYSNNRLVLTLDRKAIGFIPNGINGDPTVAGGPITLATRSDGAFADWDGGIDDVAIYNYTLTPSQIQNHFLNSTKLSIVKSGGNVVVTWPVGTLQAAPAVSGTYTNVPGATSPYTNAISGSQKYFRVQIQ